MKHEYQGENCSTYELSELSGIKPATIRYRLRQGYSLDEAIKLNPTHDSVLDFIDCSLWSDWIGMSISDLHQLYCRWCDSMQYTPISKQGFSRQLMLHYPQLKIVPIKRGDKCYRIIRRRELY